MFYKKKYKKLLQEFNELMSDRDYWKENSSILEVKVNELEQELAEAEAAFDMARQNLKTGLRSLDNSTTKKEHRWPKVHSTD